MAMRWSRNLPHVALISLLTLSFPLIAQMSFAAEQAAAEQAADEPAADTLEQRLEAALATLQEQQKAFEEQLNAQNKLLSQQGDRISALEAALDDATDPVGQIESAATPEKKASSPASEETTISRRRSATVQERIATVDAAADKAASKAENAAQVTADAQEAQQDDPTRAILESLPGAMRLPGTNAVMRWGGFVKTSFVQSFDPLAITDRFITGSIPADSASSAGIEEQNDISVSQSRLNLDLREPTNVGLVRAFIEGDFAADGDEFRLRHAFGQRGNVLAGKTWSGFVDRLASPEEVDFEGLNGRINARQAQVRIQPGIGRKYEMAISLEDPNAKVTGGEGVSRTPDIVVSGRVNLKDRLHARLALLLHPVRAQWDVDPTVTDKDWGWATSLSGRIDLPLLDSRDNLLFQLNVGSGFGRYVNDLNSVGDFDGVFDADGNIELIDVISGYVSMQHWWHGTLRSNLTLGFVELDNPGFVDDEFYKRTLRVSTNLLWSPTPRVEIGGELLWGQRENENGNTGDASQFQMAVKYLF
jgi:hypothetical protein